MMRGLFAPALLLMATSTPGTERIPADVREHVAQRVDSGRSVGLVVGVLDAKGVEYFARGQCWADGPAVDENTIFEIGSITKVFTSLRRAGPALRDSRLRVAAPGLEAPVPRPESRARIDPRSPIPAIIPPCPTRNTRSPAAD